MQTLSVPSSKNTQSSFAIAGIGDRMLAFIIDGFILGCYCPAIVWLFLDANVDDVWTWSVFFIVPLLFYSLIFEIIMKGQTPGKRAVGIRVLTVDAEAATVGQYVIRWFFTIIGFYFVSGVIAMIVIAANGKGQCFGDVVAGTRVFKVSGVINSQTFYQPVFPGAVQLDNYDVELIQRALSADDQLQNPHPLTMVSEKVKTMLGIETELSDREFLATLVKDFNHFSIR